MNKSLFFAFMAIALTSCEPEPNIPTGSKIAVFYDKSTARQVVYQIYNYDGQTEKNLTNDTLNNYWWPRLSHDGARFLCYRTPRLGPSQSDNAGSYSNADLMAFNKDGSNPTVLIPKGKYGWQAQGVAKFSPDGNKILMAAYCADTLRGHLNLQWRLVVTDINGNNPRIISSRNVVYADPAWSPDGNKVVYVSLPDSNPDGGNDAFEIYVADFNQSTQTLEAETRLTTDDLYCFDPCWSNNGQFIAFTTCKFLNTPFNSEIIRIRPDGTNKVVLIDDNLSNAVPYWTPDDSRVYFHTLGIGTSFSIASCDAINGGDKKIHLLGGGNNSVLYTSPQPTGN